MPTLTVPNMGVNRLLHTNDKDGKVRRPRLNLRDRAELDEISEIKQREIVVSHKGKQDSLDKTTIIDISHS